MGEPRQGGFGTRVLGRTGLQVGPLGLASTYNAPTAAIERAIDAGMNYLYWGSLRREAFARAIRNAASRRDQLVVVLQSYSPCAWGIVRSTERGLRSLGLDHADILLLGFWNRPVPERIRAACRNLKSRGLVRHIAMSTHNRRLVAALALDADIEVFHVRYNAVHTGAERDVFPFLPAQQPPGLVAFTATCWRRLLDPGRVPAGERVPTAGDCYRFVLSHPSVDVCMTGPATDEHVRHMLEAIERGPMSEEEIAWMRRVGAAIYSNSRRHKTR